MPNVLYPDSLGPSNWVNSLACWEYSIEKGAHTRKELGQRYCQHIPWKAATMQVLLLNRSRKAYKDVF